MRAMIWSRRDQRHHEMDLAPECGTGKTIFGQTLVVALGVPFGLCAEKALKRGAASLVAGGRVEPLFPGERESKLRCEECGRRQYMLLGVGRPTHEYEHGINLDCPACGGKLKPSRESRQSRFSPFAANAKEAE